MDEYPLVQKVASVELKIFMKSIFIFFPIFYYATNPNEYSFSLMVYAF